MRTLLLAIMIVLLPIRGWLGDAMAVEMVRHSLPAAMEAATVASAATEAHCHEAMDADAGGDMAMAMSSAHGSSHDDGSSNTSHNDHQGCGTCVACQVCHTVALGGMPVVAIVHGAPQASPAAHAARFASAEPVQGLKPPIS
ncbi:hypothetical protein EJP67_23545 [Variovorax guangxiensis]|uniref:DUF2946 domain-containing protein n=1 Tax=Variovorax guangxiensis TaxID=1775474 RepID=A0A3S1F423_9BURK|nr:DUF2946 family protein [Variovorax guangxiensis]RUR70033.1 hypothetical protein EJP67_23545 [Variovorax guangxiensis]